MLTIDELRELFTLASKEPGLVMFLVSMGIVALALYVALQAIKSKN